MTKETDEERWARWECEEAEQARLNARNFYEKVQDADSIYDLKELLIELHERTLNAAA